MIRTGLSALSAAVGCLGLMSHAALADDALARLPGRWRDIRTGEALNVERSEAATVTRLSWIGSARFVPSHAYNGSHVRLESRDTYENGAAVHCYFAVSVEDASDGTRTMTWWFRGGNSRRCPNQSVFRALAS